MCVTQLIARRSYVDSPLAAPPLRASSPLHIVARVMPFFPRNELAGARKLFKHRTEHLMRARARADGALASPLAAAAPAPPPPPLASARELVVVADRHPHANDAREAFDARDDASLASSRALAAFKPTKVNCSGAGEREAKTLALVASGSTTSRDGGAPMWIDLRFVITLEGVRDDVRDVLPTTARERFELCRRSLASCAEATTAGERRTPSLATWTMKEAVYGLLIDQRHCRDDLLIIGVWCREREGAPKEYEFDVAWNDGQTSTIGLMDFHALNARVLNEDLDKKYVEKLKQGRSMRAMKTTEEERAEARARGKEVATTEAQASRAALASTNESRRESDAPSASDFAAKVAVTQEKLESIAHTRASSDTRAAAATMKATMSLAAAQPAKATERLMKTDGEASPPVVVGKDDGRDADIICLLGEDDDDVDPMEITIIEDDEGDDVFQDASDVPTFDDGADEGAQTFADAPAQEDRIVEAVIASGDANKSAGLDAFDSEKALEYMRESYNEERKRIERILQANERDTAVLMERVRRAEAALLRSAQNSALLTTTTTTTMTMNQEMAQATTSNARVHESDSLADAIAYPDAMETRECEAALPRIIPSSEEKKGKKERFDSVRSDFASHLSVTTSAPSTSPSGLVAGAELETAVTQIMTMGFERDQVLKALRAAEEKKGKQERFDSVRSDFASHLQLLPTITRVRRAETAPLRSTQNSALLTTTTTKKKNQEIAQATNSALLTTTTTTTTTTMNQEMAQATNSALLTTTTTMNQEMAQATTSNARVHESDSLADAMAYPDAMETRECEAALPGIMPASERFDSVRTDFASHLHLSHKVYEVFQNGYAMSFTVFATSGREFSLWGKFVSEHTVEHMWLPIERVIVLDDLPQQLNLDLKFPSTRHQRYDMIHSALAECASQAMEGNALDKLMCHRNVPPHDPIVTAVEMSDRGKSRLKIKSIYRDGDVVEDVLMQVPTTWQKPSNSTWQKLKAQAVAKQIELEQTNERLNKVESRILFEMEQKRAADVEQKQAADVERKRAADVERAIIKALRQRELRERQRLEKEERKKLIGPFYNSRSFVEMSALPEVNSEDEYDQDVLDDQTDLQFLNEFVDISSDEIDFMASWNVVARRFRAISDDDTPILCEAFVKKYFTRLYKEPEFFDKFVFVMVSFFDYGIINRRDVVHILRLARQGQSSRQELQSNVQQSSDLLL